ncbi:MAG: dTDP-4-dehydrorhamnose 3,5-epimerase [Actinomycetota bacterium]|nr:dTDP-4-dehydrorhamnose 3,5-epimerase [Actinomycetota bacterium]
MVEIQNSELIDGVIVSHPDVHEDSRGLVLEMWRSEWVPDGHEIVQANRADRIAGSVVGFHYHMHQADFWYVAAGRALVVLHDLRVGSPTEGATEALSLVGSGAANHRGVYVPRGVAHGFAALSDVTITYLLDRTYDPDDELGVAWDDPEIGADWGISDPVLSPRDRINPRRVEIEDRFRPVYPGVA